MLDRPAVPGVQIRHLANPGFRRPVHSGRAADRATSAIRAAVRADPGYGPTPLLWRDGAARRMGLGALAIKYEGARLAGAGLGSFKPIGVMAALAGIGSGLSGVHTLVCASDGNYGRAVAWGAQRAGLRARIYLPERVSPDRFRGIERFGAEAMPVAGGYDRAMAAAAAAATMPGVLELSDTGYPGSEDIPRLVGAGYGIIAEECLAAWPGDMAPPTHVFVPVGVGGLAAGLAEAFDDALGRAMPALVSVEPIGAESLMASLAAGHVRSLPEAADGVATALQCLACETPSTTAWPALRRLTAHALAIDDAAAFAAVRVLACGDGEAPVLAGESGAAGYAALMSVCSDARTRRSLGLDAAARVLVMLTEGATDRRRFAEIVGHSPAALASPVSGCGR